MSKTGQLIAAVKAGTHRISRDGFVYRRLTQDNVFGGTRKGDWVRVAGKFRKDVIARAATALEKQRLEDLTEAQNECAGSAAYENTFY